MWSAGNSKQKKWTSKGLSVPQTPGQSGMREKKASSTEHETMSDKQKSEEAGAAAWATRETARELRSPAFILKAVWLQKKTALG